MGSDLLTGSLLRLLATAKPSGSILELGTGTGLATAWLLDGMEAQSRSFDLIFADMPPGKYQYLEETLQLLKSGGLYVVDDMLLQTSWNEEHVGRVYKLIATLEQNKDVRITKLNWSSGIILAAKIT
jgi:predicted O-methyltransferase YrrM